jgi:CDP-diacylglycerol---glycerol-3-phosphate 3-phosphatidyltransferase
MLTLSNILSFARAPLAFLFLQENPYLRALSILLAMFTDSIDGYLARRSKSTSKLGAILDPVMDKFFVYFVLVIFFLENRISFPQALMVLSRDFSLFIFGLYLLFSKGWRGYVFHAIRWGKVTTGLQFFILLGLTFHILFPWYVYFLFILFSILAFVELFQTRSPPSNSHP